MINPNVVSYRLSSLHYFLLQDELEVKYEDVVYDLVPQSNLEIDEDRELDKREVSLMAGFKRVIGLGRSAEQEIMEDDLGLPSWIKVKAIAGKHAGKFKGCAHNLSAHVANLGHDNEKTIFRKALMAQVQNNLIIEVAFGGKNAKADGNFKASFPMLLDTLQTLV